MVFVDRSIIPRGNMWTVWTWTGRITNNYVWSWQLKSGLLWNMGCVLLGILDSLRILTFCMRNQSSFDQIHLINSSQICFQTENIFQNMLIQLIWKETLIGFEMNYVCGIMYCSKSHKHTFVKQCVPWL